MKKLFSILLTLAMMLSLCATAFAEDTKLTIQEGSDGIERTYDGYQLLTLTSALKDGDHHTGDPDHKHDDDCYVYSYRVNEKYLAILQQETFEKAGLSVWGTEDTPTTADKVDEEHIKAYLGSLKSDGEGDTLRPRADVIYRAIQAAHIEPEKTGLKDTASIEQGYWMFVDTSNLAGENSANSMVIVDTKNLEALTIAPKVAIPVVEKKVRDIEDSEDATIADNVWHDSADFDIGDKVPFKLTGTMPDNARAYTTYTMVFHDTLSAGLKFDEASVRVYMYNTKHLADMNTRLDNPVKELTRGDDFTDNDFTVNPDPADDCSFEVTIANARAIEGATSNTAFVVYYEATLTEDATIGSAGNPNSVFLEFSNDPYDDDKTGKTEEDKVTVFTYELVIDKVDSHGHALAGAGFTLWKRLATAEAADIPEGITDSEKQKYLNGYRPVKVDTESFVVSSAGAAELGGTGSDLTTFTWKGLDDGDYILSETTTPAGYNSIEDLVFTIDAIHEETATDPKLVSINAGVMGAYNTPDGTITRNIENRTGTVLPSTGAQGTFMLIGGGTLLVILAAVFMITRKKMSIYED